MSMFPHQHPLPHYYGDVTRAVFIAVGIIMLIGMPKMMQVFWMPPAFPIIAILVVGIAAGFTTPRRYASLVLNVIVSIFGLAAFIYVSWIMRAQGIGGGLLALNQIVAVLFLVTLYFSVKSLRGYSGS